MPLLETKGAASAQGFGLTLGGAAPVYIEDVFSTWLYTGNSPSTQSIVNGIDLAGKGGMVWVKSRVSGDGSTYNNILMDTARGTGSGNILYSNLTLAAQTAPNAGISSFNSNGFSLRYDDGYGTNYPSGGTFASWTFRKQPKFFDVVTYTGNGANNRQISHSLGSTPGFIIVKNITNTQSWICYHRSLGTGSYLIFNSQSNAGSDGNAFPTVTSTFFVPTADQTAFALNTNGDTFVAYLFAHNAGGFGLTGTDNVISCGSWTDSGFGTQTITLGYEPQFVIYKRSDESSNWVMLDNMRGWPVVNAGGTTANLYPNLSNSESGGNYGGNGPNATGFTMPTFGGGTFVYIAIRRGPMKTPTSGTSVFSPIARSGTGANPTVVTTNTNPDLLMSFPRIASPDAYGMCFWDKLRSVTRMLQSSNTNSETGTSSLYTLQGWLNTGYQAGADFIAGYLNYGGSPYVNYAVTRAPGFFDEVCYTGTGSARTLNHNLGVVPEMMIVKVRNGSGIWMVYHAALGNTGAIYLNDSDIAYYSSTYWNSTTPTSSVFSLGTSGNTNGGAGQTYVNYLFASCPGVSKVGSYTGTGNTLQVDCGFTGGARFVLIKRTDSTGDWYVWDSARGIVAGNDPYLLLNSTAAEVTNTDYVDTYSAGFEISSTAPAAINANGGSFIYLAIA